MDELGTSDSRTVSCHRCGRPLGSDLDDEPDGGPDGLPLCGECARNRDETTYFEVSGLSDDATDHLFDW